MKYKIITGHEVQNKDIEDAIFLDNLSYIDCFRGKFEDCINWYKVNPDIYIMIKILNQIIAYINIMPLNEECYNKIKDGNFIDVNIKPNMIMKYEKNNTYNIYLSSIVIHPDYRNGFIFKILFDSMFKKFIEMSKNNIFIKRILSDVVTIKGEKIAKFLGMHKVNKSLHNSSIYEVSMIPPKFKITTKLTKQLFDLYKGS